MCGFKDIGGMEKAFFHFRQPFEFPINLDLN